MGVTPWFFGQRVPVFGGEWLLLYSTLRNLLGVQSGCQNIEGGWVGISGSDEGTGLFPGRKAKVSIQLVWHEPQEVSECVDLY